jgi:hypothetical protein
MPKILLIMSLMPKKSAEEDGEHQIDRSGWWQGAPYWKGRSNAKYGMYGVGTLVVLGGYTQPRQASDVHSLYSSRTVISNTETNKSNVQIKCVYF